MVPDCLVLPSARSALRRRFRRRRWVALPGLLAPALLRRLPARLRAAGFIERPFLSSRREHSPDLSELLAFLMCDPALLGFVREVTGARRPVRGVTGTAYRHRPGARHDIDWHVDTVDPPVPLAQMLRATLLVNLGGSYRGGLLELRARGPRLGPERIALPRAGDAVLFRGDLPHRGASVRGRRPKLTFACWFSHAPIRRRAGASRRSYP